MLVRSCLLVTTLLATASAVDVGISVAASSDPNRTDPIEVITQNLPATITFQRDVDTGVLAVSWSLVYADDTTPVAPQLVGGLLPPVVFPSGDLVTTAEIILTDDAVPEPDRLILASLLPSTEYSIDSSASVAALMEQDSDGYAVQFVAGVTGASVIFEVGDSLDRDTFLLTVPASGAYEINFGATEGTMQGIMTVTPVGDPNNIIAQITYTDGGGTIADLPAGDYHVTLSNTGASGAGILSATQFIGQTTQVVLSALAPGTETGTATALVLTRTGDLSSNIVVSLAADPASTMSPADIGVGSLPIVSAMPAGSATASIIFTPVSDGIPEDDEFFIVSVVPTTAIGSSGSATVAIADDTLEISLGSPIDRRLHDLSDTDTAQISFSSSAWRRFVVASTAPATAPFAQASVDVLTSQGSTLFGVAPIPGIGTCTIPPGTATFRVGSATQAGNYSFTVTEDVGPVIQPNTLAFSGVAGTPLEGTVGIAHPGGLAVTMSVSTQPAQGTVVITSTVDVQNPANTIHSFAYSTPSNAATNQSFAIEASDGVNLPQSATISVTLASGNQPPTAPDVSTSTDEDTSVDVTISGTDPESDPFTLSVMGGQLGSALILDQSSQSIRYVPNPDRNGTDTVLVTLSDATGSSTAAITVAIQPINDVPQIARSPGQLAVVGLPYRGLLVASDVDGDSLTLTLNSDSWLYAVARGANAVDLLGTPGSQDLGENTWYVTVDDGQVSSQELVTINVVAPTLAAVDTPAIPVSSGDNFVYTMLSGATDAGLARLRAFFATASPDQARAFAWDAAAQAYVALPATPGGGLDLHHGVFVATTEPITLDLSGDARPGPALMPLEPGWNLIGISTMVDPGLYTSFSANWVSTLDDDGQPVDTNSVLGADSRPYRWDGAAYVRSDTLIAGSAYWYKNRTNRRALLFLRPQEAENEGAPQRSHAAASDSDLPPAPPAGSRASNKAGGGCGGGAGLGLLLAAGLLVLRRFRR
jgi:hypothetical protein